jgi:Flp pilus assembly protein TadD
MMKNIDTSVRAFANLSDPASTDLEQLLEQVRSEPNRGDIRYLLGAQWAAAGRYDMAVAEMTNAVALDPKLHTAHLQLGLLHLTMGRPAEAVAAWRSLDMLDAAEPLRIFKHGLEALIRDDFAGCVTLLEAGIRANHTNSALNRDMAMVIERVRPNVPGSTRTNTVDASAGGATGVRTDFSLYDPKKH